MSAAELKEAALAIEIAAVLASLPDDTARIRVLEQLLTNRCRKCLDYDPQGQFWCCYESREY